MHVPKCMIILSAAFNDSFIKFIIFWIYFEVFILGAIICVVTRDRSVVRRIILPYSYKFKQY